MKSDDYRYLDRAKTAIIGSAIQRLAETGRMEYSFTLSADEVKEGLGRERLREETIDDVLVYFGEEGIDAQHDAKRDRFRLTVDLETTVMSPGEAGLLSEALMRYRTLHE